MKSIFFFLLLAFATDICASEHRAKVEVAITIDDFPALRTARFTLKERTERLIGAADAAKCKVVFFCVGQGCMQEDQRICLALVDEAGHFLANHSMTHPFTSGISTEDFIKEVEGAEKILAAYKRVLPVWRYPYLDYGNIQSKGGSAERAAAARAALEARGYQEGYVTINTFDFLIDAALWQAEKSGATIDYKGLGTLYVGLVREWCKHYINAYRELAGEGVVHTLLLHANELNALFLGDILDMICAEGWSIVSPADVFTVKPGSPTSRILPDPSAPKPETLDRERINAMLTRACVFKAAAPHAQESTQVTT